MGICYAEEQEWEAYQSNYRTRRKNRKKTDFSSIIYQQKTIHESFASKVEGQVRDDLHNTLNLLASSGQIGSIAFGSVAQISESQLQTIYKSLQQINPGGQRFNPNEVVTLCNLKTKNYMHTHKIKHPCMKKFNQVSACPYNSNHIVQYDLWKIIPIQNDKNYIYHPLTQSFLSVSNGKVVCGQPKYQWKIQDFGPRRSGGFIKIIAEVNGQDMELCMTDQAGILPNHRKIQICNQKHIGHLWEIQFGQCVLQPQN